MTRTATQTRAPRRTLTGLGLIAFAVFMNVPFTLLGISFDYPDILRRPTAEILSRFEAGGDSLILTWQLYVLACVLMIPAAYTVRSIFAARDGAPYTAATALAVAAAICQAVGLTRWVFAVPGLSDIVADPASSQAAATAATVMFQTLHQFAGVGIGENLGQTFTALWLLTLNLPGLAKGRIVTGVLGVLAGLLILIGTAEGFATVMAFDPGPIALFTPVGFLVLSLWLAATGTATLLRRI